MALGFLSSPITSTKKVELYYRDPERKGKKVKVLLLAK